MKKKKLLRNLLLKGILNKNTLKINFKEISNS